MDYALMIPRRAKAAKPGGIKKRLNRKQSKIADAKFAKKGRTGQNRHGTAMPLQ
jgi:hypothetical protein